MKTRARGRSRFGTLVILALVVLMIHSYSKRKAHEEAQFAPSPSIVDENTPVEREDRTITFKCDGRTRCTQMTSCEEATYFLRNCPGTKMDGDNDGIPCEDQWCRR